MGTSLSWACLPASLQGKRLGDLVQCSQQGPVPGMVGKEGLVPAPHPGGKRQGVQGGDRSQDREKCPTAPGLLVDVPGEATGGDLGYPEKQKE